MAITTRPEDRDKGVVFLDPALQAGPATHVMIVGVGRFQSPQVAALTSPPKSALAMADWFLGLDGPHTFVNPERPLGSLAVAISAEADDAPTRYAGADVPRAKFALVKAALSAWVDRINSNKDNLAVLYVCSHGESLGAKTGFLLEEYGTQRNDSTAGLSEVEQFARALKNALPVRQLLIFDCCRSETSLNLPLEEEFGTKLISLSKRPDDHGESRQQWILAATALNEISTGRKNMTTVFTDSLLRSLKGAAADSSNGDWRVTPADLVRTVPKFLSLHRRAHEPMQTPSGQFADPFPVCFGEEPKLVQAYLALKDENRWAGCRLTVVGATRMEFEGADPPGPERFAVAEVEERQPIEIIALDRDGLEIGKASRKPRAPAEYVIIGADDAVSVRSHVSPAAGGWSAGDGGGGGNGGGGGGGWTSGGGTAVTINSRGPMALPNAALVKLTRIDLPGPAASRPHLMNIAWPDSSDTKTFSVEPGTYRIAFETPDGRHEATVFEAEVDSVTDVDLGTVRSPQEWLRGVWAAGLVQGTGDDSVLDAQPGDVGAEFLSSANAARRLDWPLHPSSAAVAPADMSGIAMTPEPYRQDRFRGFRIDYRLPEESKYILPAWIELSHGAAHELSALPMVQDAVVSLVLDRSPPAGASATCVAVESARWTPLFGYLARRNFAAGEVVVGASRDGIRAAVQEKMGDPFAAVAAALIAVGSGRFERFGIDEQWLRNLADWFPGIPDGPIVLARHLAGRARTAAEHEQVRTLLLEGFGRGVPVFSLSLEWLEDGLSASDETDARHEDARKAARTVRRVSVRIDPSKPFTTIRLDPAGPP
jgi:hypothetical protein